MVVDFAVLCCVVRASSRAEGVGDYDAEDARGLMKAAIRDPDLVVFLENELLYVCHLFPRVCWLGFSDPC